MMKYEEKLPEWTFTWLVLLLCELFFFVPDTLVKINSFSDPRMERHSAKIMLCFDFCAEY